MIVSFDLYIICAVFQFLHVDIIEVVAVFLIQVMLHGIFRTFRQVSGAVTVRIVAENRRDLFTIGRGHFVREVRQLQDDTAVSQYGRRGHCSRFCRRCRYGRLCRSRLSRNLLSIVGNVNIHMVVADIFVRINKVLTFPIFLVQEILNISYRLIHRAFTDAASQVGYRNITGVLFIFDGQRLALVTEIIHVNIVIVHRHGTCADGRQYG